jgi:acylphosphatase
VSSSHRAVHVLIEGRVQGVGFRAWVAARAGELRLSGYVRNRRSGGVEAEFSGPAAAVAAMLEFCRKGPPASVVTGVDVIGKGMPPAAMSPAAGFEVRPTL